MQQAPNRVTLHSPRFHFRGCVGVGAGGLPRSDGDDGWSVYISLKISGSAEKC